MSTFYELKEFGWNKCNRNLFGQFSTSNMILSALACYSEQFNVLLVYFFLRALMEGECIIQKLIRKSEISSSLAVELTCPSDVRILLVLVTVYLPLSSPEICEGDFNLRESSLGSWKENQNTPSKTEEVFIGYNYHSRSFYPLRFAILLFGYWVR